MNYRVDRPRIKERTNKTKNIKNKTFAIPAAPAASPPKPSIAAIIAMIRNVIVQRNIIDNFWLGNNLPFQKFRKRAKSIRY